MRAFRYLERLDQLAWLTRFLQLLTLVLAIGILFLARHRTILHIVPAAFPQDYRIGPNMASRQYLEQMATLLTTAALTVNPDNADYAARAFLHHLTTEARARLEPLLLADATYIRKNYLTQAFYPKSIDFYSPTRLKVTGTLVQWVGGKVITQRDSSYNLTLEVKNYAVTLSDFEHVEQDTTHATVAPAGVPAPAPAADTTSR